MQILYRFPRRIVYIYDHIHDVEGDFAEGTSVSDRTGLDSLEVLMGRVASSSLYGATVSGIIDFGKSTDGLVGGIVGDAMDRLTMARNLAMFPNGIAGYYTGGIAGIMNYGNVLSFCLNAMKGTVTGSIIGGIIGQCLGSCQLDSVVNVMTGNIRAVPR